MIKKLLFAISFAVSLFAGQQNIDKSFELTSIDGKKIHVHVRNNGIDVKEYPNKVIILDFFGKNCPPCKAEMPILGKIQQRQKDKLQILGLHVQRPLSKSDIEELKKRGVNYPVFDYLQTEQNRLFVDYMGQLTGWGGSIPFMLFFDKKGDYAGYYLGMAEEKSLEKFIEKLYDQKQEPKPSKKSEKPKTPSKESNTTKK